MLGVALAGGKGTRLNPLTKIYNKHFLLVKNKPIIFYCLKQFQLLKIQNICVVCNSKDYKSFKLIIDYYFNFKNIYYVNQNNPKGVLHGINLVKKKFRKSDLLINLGDHFLFNFKGNNEVYKNINKFENIIFSIKSKNVKDYGNLYFSTNKKKLIKIIEKPTRPYSDYILCGLLKVSSDLANKIKLNKKSKRNEYEWVDFINEYIELFSTVKLNSSYKWVDLGTFERLNFANRILNKHENF